MGDPIQSYVLQDRAIGQDSRAQPVSRQCNGVDSGARARRAKDSQRTAQWTPAAGISVPCQSIGSGA
jgi:hypothetical protein